MPTTHQHWLYVWVPLVTAGVWFGTLLAMLITYLAQGRPHYVSEDGSIAYISDVGADILKPLFVTGCAITFIGFFLSLVIERWLRHSGRLIAEMRRRERVFSILAIIGSFIGGLGLLLLSIFDTKRHPSLHRVFLLVFIIGVGLSAIFTIIEYRWISHDFVELRKLKFAYIIKGVIAAILIILAVVFAITLYTAQNVGAVIEWTIAFGYTFYLLTFAYDLRMAKGVHRGQFSRKRLLDLEKQGVPISAAAAGHEGNAGVAAPYNHSGRYAPSTTTTGTIGTADGHPVTYAGNDRGANGGYAAYNTRGYA
ncbi:Frag1/DRAM/Sfk1 family protein [Phanerochaete sordida]|uniref:Frag1/DRAM/Sfk1 family protein n=1 Tax=Phanerochaete sordida TaxID=48140 RepID=A0A9P3GJK6_9APHY|nr:Frag1/DRAM/Sfk1 family protein [Phanerochaete sordida]